MTVSLIVLAGLFTWLSELLTSAPPVTPARPSAKSVYKDFLIWGKYAFRIEFRLQRNGSYKLYCLSHPRIPSGYSTKVDDCHLYSNKEICISAGKEPYTFDRAVALAKYFCHGFSTYVDTGVFPNKAETVRV